MPDFLAGRQNDVVAPEKGKSLDASRSPSPPIGVVAYASIPTQAWNNIGSVYGTVRGTKRC